MVEIEDDKRILGSGPYSAVGELDRSRSARRHRGSLQAGSLLAINLGVDGDIDKVPRKPPKDGVLIRRTEQKQ